MLKRLLVNISLVVVAVVLTSIFQPFSHIQTLAQQSAGCRTFPETGNTVCGKFLQYWDTHGGLAQQGFPLTGEFTEKSALNGQTYTVQYFERAVFEMHPENKPPYDVLLSQLGTFRYRDLYGEGGLPPRPQPVPQPVPTGPAAR